MRILFAAMLLMFTSAAVADLVPTTPAEEMMDALDNKDISYFWRNIGDEIYVFLLDKTDPKIVCDLAKTHVGLNAMTVYSFETLTPVKCDSAK